MSYSVKIKYIFSVISICYRCRYLYQYIAEEYSDDHIKFDPKAIRVFNIDIEVCEHCGGQVKVMASIEDPAVIGHILKHLKHKANGASAKGRARSGVAWRPDLALRWTGSKEALSEPY